MLCRYEIKLLSFNGLAQKYIAYFLEYPNNWIVGLFFRGRSLVAAKIAKKTDETMALIKNVHLSYFSVDTSTM